MAKKGNRILIGLSCDECKHRNYVTTKSTINTKDKITLKKFCEGCRKNTSHIEVSKLK